MRERVCLLSTCREQVPPRAARVLAHTAQAVHDTGEEVAMWQERAHSFGVFNTYV